MANKKIKKITKNLLEAFVALDNNNDILNFLSDLLTEQELIEFSQRLEIAKMLEDGIPYIEIEKKVGASSRTIARVAKFLNGDNGGYKNVLRHIINN